nr:MAG: hypothetical protein DIU54_15140 [Acidobacteriota bacterium]
MLLQMPPTPQQPGSRRRVTLTLLLAAAGVAVLAWTIDRLGLDAADLRAGLADVGWWFVAILLLSFVRFVLRARAWVELTGLPIPLRDALAATISGDAIGNLTPLGLIASEPSKALYLRRQADPGGRARRQCDETFFETARTGA